MISEIPGCNSIVKSTGSLYEIFQYRGIYMSLQLFYVHLDEGLWLYVKITIEKVSSIYFLG